MTRFKKLYLGTFLRPVVELVGPFKDLDAEAITEELDVMWKTLHKLGRTFSNLPGPQLVAKSFQSKVEQFKMHLPVLSTISNPGMKERHWKQVSFYPVDMKSKTVVFCSTDVNFLSTCRSAVSWALNSNQTTSVRCLTCWMQDFLIILTSKHRIFFKSIFRMKPGRKK